MQPIIHVFGRPGSGKGTLADALADRRGWRHLRMGAALTRWAARAETTEQRDLADRLTHGELAQDEQVIALVREFLASLPNLVPGVVFDGFPRTMGQLAMWETLDYPSLGVLVDTPVSVCLERMQLRQTCVLCGHTQADGSKTCERCESLLTVAPADRNQAALSRRFEIYAHVTEPLIDIWAAHQRPLVTVENVRHPLFMFRTILALAARLEREAAGLPELERRSTQRVSFAPRPTANLDVHTIEARLGLPCADAHTEQPAPDSTATSS